ncbi:phage minor head protein [Prescottella agglutinans]|uniref:Phage head morphogenesis domain-containing protein n=1 Tax=Prescottella agglutinans TaxID=1644129 RepID=A0ABT6M5E1_9NOCA|nr:phage minor head protein [Prescottella agglutinans]MDH6279522.1 hypothetical protein [Prescottella agglutinans]
MTRGEHRLHTGLVAAMTVWLDTARALVLGQPVPDTAAALLADAGDPTPEPDLDAARASFSVWERALEQHVFPVLDEAFGEGFAANQRAADISVVHWQELAMATVHDRLKIWPEGAFEELRPELLEAMANNEDIDQVQDRIGRVLGIDAPARRIRAEISAVDRKLKDPTTPRAEIPILKGKRRQLWNQHDERNLEWQWLARRIARTEIQAAMEAGALAAAQASEEITGEKMYKRWLSTHDERTRLSHAVADGQMVRLTEPFIVGGTPIQHPADPAGLAHETINCRCTLAILSWAEMQAELQGMWGGRGVGPMNARLGPDDEAAVATAIDRLQRERNGEVIDDATTTTVVTDEASAELAKRRKVRTPEGAKKFHKPVDSYIDGGPDASNLPDGGKSNPDSTKSDTEPKPARQPQTKGPTSSGPPTQRKGDSPAPNQAPADHHDAGSGDSSVKPEDSSGSATEGEKALSKKPPIIPQGIVIEGERPGGSPPRAPRKTAQDIRDLGERLGLELVAPPDDPDRYFDEDQKAKGKPGREETTIANWVRSQGIDVASVSALPLKGQHGTIPEAIVIADDETIEFKTVSASTARAIRGAIESAKQQSDRVVVYAVPGGIAREVAEAGMRNGIRDAGAHMVEIVVVVSVANANEPGSEDVVLSWSHG